jgi:hypothetical protein
MFLDCPAYLDQDGTRRCGLPAEVRSRFVLRSSDGPLEAAAIKCPAGHWFNGPIESLTWDRTNNRHPGHTDTAASATGHSGDGRHAGSPGTPAATSPAARAGIIARPHTAPAYYQGRPAHIWISAMTPRRGRQPATDTQPSAGHGQTPNPAHQPFQALA